MRFLKFFLFFLVGFTALVMLANAVTWAFANLGPGFGLAIVGVVTSALLAGVVIKWTEVEP